MSRRRWLPSLLFAAYWAAGSLYVLSAAIANSVPVAGAKPGGPGTPYPGELHDVLIVLLCEAGISGLILQPWSYRQSWDRAVLVLLILTPWLLILGALGLHAGPATGAHLVWLMLLWAGLAIIGIRGWFAKRKAVT